MNSKNQNIFANVRKIVALGVVCMLLFAVVSCERSKDPFELDEDDIFTENCFSEELFTAKFYVLDSKGSDNWRWFLFYDTGSPRHFHGLHAVPISLPEEFQIGGLHVNVTYRYHVTGKQIYGYPIIKIEEIDRAFFTTRLYVRKMDDCGYLLFGDLPRPWQRLNTFKPINLPEKFQVDGLRVDATFHLLWHLLQEIEPCEDTSSAFPIEIITIMNSPEDDLPHAETRITGGEGVQIETTPWQVLISSNGGLGHCGGSIIASNFILTTRGCIGSLPPSAIRVYAGITCRSEINNNNTFGVSRIIPHPDPTIDVALLQLSRNIPFNNKQQPINFLASSNSAFYNIGNRVRVSGWGWTRPGTPGSIAECLHAVYIYIISNQQASNIFPDQPLFDHEMAAVGIPDGINREGICPGDGGGALTIRSVSGEPVHIGIASSVGESCAGTNHNCPSIFVRTSHVAPWIDSVIRILSATITGSGSCCPGTTATFSIPPLPPNATVRWIADAPLSITTSNQTSVTVRHTGATTLSTSRVRAEISLNGQIVHTVVREVVVNRPVIHSLEVPALVLQARRPHTFTVSHDNSAYVVWNVSGSAVMEQGQNVDTRIINFTHSGNYTITVTSSNACGTSTRSVTVTVPQDFTPPHLICPSCEFHLFDCQCTVFPF